MRVGAPGGRARCRFRMKRSAERTWPGHGLLGVQRGWGWDWLCWAILQGVRGKRAVGQWV